VGKKTRINLTGIAILVFFLLLGVLVSMRLTGLGKEFPNPIGGYMKSILSPVEEKILNLGSAIQANTRALWSFREVEAENAALRAKVEQLTGDNIELKEQVLAGMRFEALEGEFNSPTLDKYEKIGASIVNRSPNSWYQTITLNRGSRDGIMIDDPVVTHMGLVGKVVSVTSTTSEVLLISDGEGKVSALVRGSSGEAAFGIVEGTYKRGARLTSEGKLQMLFRREDKVNVGDLVLTSGMGGVYPKDVPVGRVQEIELDSSGLMKTAVLEPLVNFDALEEVYIVKGVGGK